MTSYPVFRLTYKAIKVGVTRSGNPRYTYTSPATGEGFTSSLTKNNIIQLLQNTAYYAGRHSETGSRGNAGMTTNIVNYANLFRQFAEIAASEGWLTDKQIDGYWVRQFAKGESDTVAIQAARR